MGERVQLKGQKWRQSEGKKKKKKVGPSIGQDNFSLIAALFGDSLREVYCPHAAAREQAIK